MSESHHEHASSHHQHAKTTGEQSVPYNSAQPPDLKSQLNDPIYALSFAIIFGSIILSAALFLSADRLGTYLSAMNLTSNVVLPNNLQVQQPAPQPSAVAQPQAQPTPTPTPVPAPIPSAAAGCGPAPSAVPSAPAAKVNIDVSGRPFKGDPNAKVTIVEFSEFLCPFCKRAEATMDQIQKDYGGKVKLVYMHYLVHGEAPRKMSIAAECAHKQGKYWEYHNLLFANQKSDEESLKSYAQQVGLDVSKFSACLTSDAAAQEVDRQNNLGKSLGVSGTPTFFINGQKLVGAQPIENFKAMIDAELAKK